METLKKTDNASVRKIISTDRERTNLLRNPEQKLIAYLVQRIPLWISSNMLSFIGFMGGVIVFLSFVLAAYVDRSLLLIGVLGYLISWFGDSLDGRIAYYRKIPRKWYGFALDITTDWLGIILMGLGFVTVLGVPAISQFFALRLSTGGDGLTAIGVGIAGSVLLLVVRRFIETRVASDPKPEVESTGSDI